ncbi:DMT family transporter [Allokutzneria sp. NRRL B-24872]|uniref:DMT family transporter n=1 Tax=Allokutzneria sp. NRRL B-24872 TaxID=1137961 RepID=UPI001AEFA51B|nr:DMT family transporter [Allokutzneria sp. NRRL B-24872]
MSSRVDPVTGVVLAVAVLAVSSSGPLTAFAAAPALAIAFWRNAIAVAALTPFAAARRGAEFRGLVRGEHRTAGWFSVAAGVALAVHFSTWMPSVQLTSVATATALVATQPVWQCAIASMQGKRLPAATWVGISLAVVGAVIATGADFEVSATALTGDLLALAGGLMAAIYTALGERARVTISTTTYTSVCYSVCGVLLLGVCLVGGVPLVGFDGATWLAILGLVAGAQLLGHSMFSFALRKVSATTVSLMILLEVPGAALIAWVWLGQVPRAGALPGLALLLLGVAVVIVAGTRTRDVTPARAVSS